MKPENLTSEQKHQIIIAAAEDKKANYTTSIDLRGKTLIADYFVICSGTSNIHIRSIADGIIEAMERRGHRQEVLEGYGEASWILLSYGDVIAHIMSETQRDYYKLERLWGTGETAAEPSRLSEIPPEVESGFESDDDDEELDLDADGSDEEDESEGEIDDVAGPIPGGNRR